MSEAEQVEQYATTTLTKTWTDPATGNVADPGTVTIGITRADGTVAVAAGTATVGGGAAARTYSLGGAATALLDWLDVTWTSSVYGPRRPDRVDVVGGFLFSLTEGVAALPDRTLNEVREARSYAETQLEAELGYAVVPRYSREAIPRKWANSVRPLWGYVRTIRSVSVDGTVLAPADVANLQLSPAGLLLPSASNWWGWSRVTVGYEHGLDRPSPAASRAALALAQDQGNADSDAAIDSRATSIVTVDGTVQLRAGGVFGIPAVDQFLAANRLPLVA